MTLHSKHEIPRRTHELIRDYMGEIQENMRLCNWYISVSRNFARKNLGCEACIWIADEGHEATIYIAKSFLKLDRPYQRKVMVHELCHLILEPVNWNLNLNSKPRGKNNQANDNIHQSMELAVDDYAHLIAPHQPLPPMALPHG